MSESIRRSELPAYKELEYGRFYFQIYRLPLNGYSKVEVRNEWNGYVPANAKRIRFESGMNDWEALELLDIELTRSLLFHGENGEERREKRTIHVAARDYDEATKIVDRQLNDMMSCGMIGGWMNF